MWCCMPGVHSASMRSELALAGVDQPVGPRPTQGGAGLDIPPNLCSCADGRCLSAAALLLACLHVLACQCGGERGAAEEESELKKQALDIVLLSSETLERGRGAR